MGQKNGPQMSEETVSTWLNAKIKMPRQVAASTGKIEIRY